MLKPYIGKSQVQDKNEGRMPRASITPRKHKASIYKARATEQDEKYQYNVTGENSSEEIAPKRLNEAHPKAKKKLRRKTKIVDDGEEPGPSEHRTEDHLRTV